MWKPRRIASLICSSLLLGACLQTPADEEVRSLNRATMTVNGFRLNGLRLNGLRLNGLRLNGLTLNGLTLNGPSQNGLTLNGLTLNGLTLNGLTLNGLTLNGSKLEYIAWDGSQLKAKILGSDQILSGQDVAGITVTVQISQGQPSSYSIKIESAKQDTAFPDVWEYQLSYKSNTDPAYQPVCVSTRTGAAEPGIFLLGSSWDETTGNREDSDSSATFACVDGVIAKCVHTGYRPWASASTCRRDGKKKNCSQVSLKDHHQACTRMLRADYCGDGKPWTLDGTVLDIFDYLEPPVQLREEAWTFEARWLPTGAMCLSKQRHPELGFGGKCVDSKGKERTLRPCNPYEEDKGLIVSTFNGSGPTGVKGDSK